MISCEAPRVLVSVIIPAYNAERYILEAVESVLAQTLTDLELIVVDDGSTDGTLALVKSLPDPRLRVLSGSNGGAARARGLGCAAAQSSVYFAFQDADDVWARDKLQQQVDFLESHPEVGSLGCFMRYISSAGRRLGETGSVVGPKEQAEVAAGRLFPFPMPSLLVRRSTWDEAGGFDESLAEGSEDLDLYSRLARHGLMECLPSVLGSVRIHPRSMMARDRVRVNRAARFVRERIARRDRGEELTWDEFAAAHRRTWREWRQDRLEVCYRTAALWYGERRLARALAYGGLAFLIGPRYTLRRVNRQRLGGDSGQ